MTTVGWDGWIDITSRKTHMTFYRCPSGTVCFRQVFRREDNGETNKSCIHTSCNFSSTTEKPMG